MKRILLFLFIMIFLLNGCSVKKVTITKIEKPTGKALEFMEQMQKENGIYLSDISATKKYLFLNGSIYLQYESPTYFSDVTAETDSNKNLIITFTEYEAGAEKKDGMESLLLFEINLPDGVDTIKLYKNGEETNFKSIYVNNY